MRRTRTIRPVRVLLVMAIAFVTLSPIFLSHHLNKHASVLQSQPSAIGMMKRDGSFHSLPKTHPQNALTAASASTINRRLDPQLEIATHHPNCTAEQMEILSVQLPELDCKKHKKFPWTSNCSFSRATSCPDSMRWLQPEYSTTASHDHFVSFFVGCNKGIDAVNALRMGSQNAKYDVDVWKSALLSSESQTAQQHNASGFAGSSCAQFDKAQVDVQATSVRPATVYCFEPVSATFEKLYRSKLHLQWNNDFILEQAAFAMDRGTMQVSDRFLLGAESGGLKDFEHHCRRQQQLHANGKDVKLCSEIPVYTLDDYVGTLSYMTGDASSTIDFLSIDVEGYDLDVLLGGQKLLAQQQVQYLEFEYNWKGKWKTQRLRDAIDMLQGHGYVCYWPGTNGNIWRITGCWQKHYRHRYWSNVACVHVGMLEAKSLASRMEAMFLETLKKGESLRM